MANTTGGICILSEANALSQINTSLRGDFRQHLKAGKGSILQLSIDSLKSPLTAASADADLKPTISKAVHPHPPEFGWVHVPLLHTQMGSFAVKMTDFVAPLFPLKQFLK